MELIGYDIEISHMKREQNFHCIYHMIKTLHFKVVHLVISRLSLKNYVNLIKIAYLVYGNIYKAAFNNISIEKSGDI